MSRTKSAGFTAAQAEAVIEVVRSAHEANLSDLATKSDLRAGLAETKAEILKWMFGAMAFQTLAVIGGVIAAGRLLPS